MGSSMEVPRVAVRVKRCRTVLRGLFPAVDGDGPRRDREGHFGEGELGHVVDEPAQRFDRQVFRLETVGQAHEADRDARLETPSRRQVSRNAAEISSVYAWGETLAVADLSDRQAVLEMTRMIRARGNAMKLIPLRAAAIGGLVELRDAINIVRAGRGGLFAMRSSDAAEAKWIFVYDGSRLLPVPQLPRVEPTRIFVVRLDSIDSYVAYERTR